MIRPSKKVRYPDCVGKSVQCEHCGGLSRVTKSTSIFVVHEVVSVRCPFCSINTPVENDIFKINKEKYLKFLLTQVEPIKAIENEDIRLPLQKLVDSLYSLLNE